MWFSISQLAQRKSMCPAALASFANTHADRYVMSSQNGQACVNLWSKDVLLSDYLEATTVPANTIFH